jgi:hypothetical protein
MNNVLSSPAKSLTLGLLIVVAIIAVWVALSGVDAIGFTSFLLRAVHIVSAMIWVGMSWAICWTALYSPRLFTSRRCATSCCGEQPSARWRCMGSCTW